MRIRDAATTSNVGVLLASSQRVASFPSPDCATPKLCFRATLEPECCSGGHERGGVDGGGAGGAESADSKSGGQVCETANRQVDATVRRAQVRGLAILDVRGSLVLS